MASLGERIDLILAYGVEGNEDLNALRENLENSEKATTDLIKKEAQLQKTTKSSGKDQRDIAKALRSRRARQSGLNRAMEEAQNVLKDNQLQLEYLKLEYEDGNISAREYAEGLQDLRNDLERLDVPSKQVASQLRRLSSTQNKAERQMRKTTGTARGATSAFGSMFQILQDLPYGFHAVSNNIPFAAQQMGHFSENAKQSGGVMKNLIGFLSGPAGITIALASLIPLIATATQKWDLFGDKQEEVKKKTDRLKESISSQLDEVFGDFSTEQEITAIENAIDEMMGINDVKEATEGQTNALQNLVDEYGKAEMQANTFHTTASDRAPAQSVEIANEAIEEQQSRQGKINNLVLEELNRRLAVAKANQAVASSLREIREANEMPELQEDDMESPDFEVDVPEVGEVDDKKFKEMRSRFETLWSNISGVDSIGLLDDFEEHILSDAQDMVVSNKQRQQQLITQIEERFAEKRNQIKEKEVQQAKQAELAKRRERQRTIQGAMQLLGALQGFGQVIYGQSEENAKKAFRVNKALNLAQAIANGANAVNRALAEGGLPLAAIVGAASAANIAKIAATKFRGGGQQGQSEAQYRPSYKGMDTSAMTTQHQNIPRSDEKEKTFKLVDRSGKLLTRLQQAQDKEGGNDYLIKE